MKVNINDYYTKNDSKVQSTKVKKVNKKHHPIIELFFGTLNVIVAAIVILAALVLKFLGPILNQLLNYDFPFNTNPLIFLSTILLILGVLLELYSLEKAKDNDRKVFALIIFFFSFFMVFSITFVIIKYSFNWLGSQLFGLTEIGMNRLFYIPTIVYLIYSFFIVYYSFSLVRD